MSPGQSSTRPEVIDASDAAIIGTYQVDEHDQGLRHITSLPVELVVRFDEDSTIITNDLVLQLNETARNLAATVIGRRQANLDFPEVAVVGHGDSYDSVSGAQTEAAGTTLTTQIAYHLGAMQSRLPAERRIAIEELAIDGLVDPHVPADSVHILVDYRAGYFGAQVGTLVEPRRH